MKIRGYPVLVISVVTKVSTLLFNLIFLLTLFPTDFLSVFIILFGFSLLLFFFFIFFAKVAFAFPITVKLSTSLNEGHLKNRSIIKHLFIYFYRAWIISLQRVVPGTYQHVYIIKSKECTVTQDWADWGCRVVGLDVINLHSEFSQKVILVVYLVFHFFGAGFIFLIKTVSSLLLNLFLAVHRDKIALSAQRD